MKFTNRKQRTNKPKRVMEKSITKMEADVMFSTTDYDVFERIGGNREISKRKVDDIKKSIQNYGYQKSKPVLINRDWQIIDGQHRFQACRELGIPVLYVFAANGADSGRLMIEMNRTQHSWNSNQYINYFAMKGVYCHSEIKRIMMEYGFNYTVTVVICGLLNVHGHAKKLQSGEDLPLNPYRDKIAQLLKGFSDLPFTSQKAFASAFTLTVSKLTDRQIAKLHKNRMKIPQCATLGQYITVFENILKTTIK